MSESTPPPGPTSDSWAQPFTEADAAAVEAQLGRVADEILPLQRVLPSEDEVEPRPEHLLLRGRLGGPCGEGAVRMVRQMPHDVAQIVTEAPVQVFP